MEVVATANDAEEALDYVKTILLIWSSPMSICQVRNGLEMIAQMKESLA